MSSGKVELSCHLQAFIDVTRQTLDTARNFRTSREPVAVLCPMRKKVSACISAECDSGTPLWPSGTPSIQLTTSACCLAKCLLAGSRTRLCFLLAGTGLGTSRPSNLSGLHTEVDVLAFTGSGPVGRRLLEYSARCNLKRVYLELGGKSPNIVFADAPDIDQAAKVSAYGIFCNSDQVCVAGSRLLVEKSIHEAFSEKVARTAESMKVGDPLQLTR